MEKKPQNPKTSKPNNREKEATDQKTTKNKSPSKLGIPPKLVRIDQPRRAN
jgi:hypothetical protein